MLPTPRNYAICPSVIPADVESEMTVSPCEKAFLLVNGEEYSVTIIPVNGDETSYYEPSCRETLIATACGGVLRFRYTFCGEQEYLIILEHGERMLQEFVVFSLYEDLYRLRPMKGDLHGHSYRSDGRRDPSALAGHYREQGYDFFALTDHNRYYPGGEVDETFSGIQLGLTHVAGEEVHAPGSVVHIVHIGGTKSVADLYVNERENYQREIEKYMARVPENVPGKYAERYAKAMWATDRIHEAGGLAIFPHPYWRPGKSRVYNVCDELACLLLNSGMFDVYELLGGMGQTGNNRSVSLWGELRADGLRIPVVGSSDVHGIEKSTTFPHVFTICFANDADSRSIIDAVKKGNCVAVEATGDEYARQYRCYGSLRLVTYAQYLLNHYFPEQQRRCQGEGIAMRAYAMGAAAKELIEMQVAQTEDYRRQFFGRKAPDLPGEEIIEFEERWRKIHCKGPLTKGSGLDAPPVTRQI